MELIQVVSCTIHYFDQITQIFVIGSYFEDIETNLPIKKNTTCVFTRLFEAIVIKSLLRCFIYEFVSFCFISVSVLTINAAEHNVVAYSHAYVYG